MLAASLPLEIQQQIFSYLDSNSFYAARSVCRWWRFASSDSLTLWRQLRKLPIYPQVEKATATPQQLVSLFGKAAYTLMLGIQVKPLDDEQGSLRSLRRIRASPRISATVNGNKMATINDRTVALFDMSGSQPNIVAQRPLNDSRKVANPGPWLGSTPSSYQELALSSDGRLLAVAQELTIHIFDLLDPQSSSVSEVIANAADQSICGIEFDQDQYMLRALLDKKGAVLYLGMPKEPGTIKKAGIEHWRSPRGMKHTFLNSSLLAPIPGPSYPEHMLPYLSGLQILKSFGNGYLFAAQKHGGGESSHYVLGHVTHSGVSEVSTPGVEMGTVSILAKLESFLSNYDYARRDVSDTGMGLWDSTPSAHEHHPHFALSQDRSFLVLAERYKKRIRPMAQVQIFVYRLSECKGIVGLLRQKVKQRLREVEPSTRSVEDLEPSMDGTHSIARIPLCLGTVAGEARHVSIDRVQNGTQDVHIVKVITDERTKAWSLVGRL